MSWAREQTYHIGHLLLMLGTLGLLFHVLSYYF